MSKSLPRPVNDRLIVKVLPKPEQSDGGILIPGSAKEMFEEGEVIKSGSDLLKVGETMVYPQHLGVELMHKGEKHKWLNASEVWGVNVEDEK